MNVLWEELSAGLGDAAHLVRVVVRLVAAMLLGAVVGYERERAGHWAGLRTHMLVALGSALMVLIPSQLGQAPDAVTRVIQGIATGIGFIGAGSILKLTNEREIHGLTTAAGIWVTAAIGIAAGLGFLGMATLAVVLAWIVLGVFARLEPRMPGRAARSPAGTADRGGDVGHATRPNDPGQPTDPNDPNEPNDPNRLREPNEP